MWFDTAERLPDNGHAVEVITESYAVRELFYDNNMFWLPGKEMYVYFVPVRWRYI
jgi:hypothetical protein